MLQSRSFLRKVKGGKRASNLSESTIRRQLPRRDELTQQQQLPYELLLHIFSYVESRNDIVNLCRCSSMLRNIAEVYLYRSIHLNFEGGSNGHAKKALKLLDTIQNPHFSTVVTEVRVKFQACRQRIDTTRGEALPKICTCGTIDKNFGTALRSMRALEVLRIDCFLCMNLSTGRHHYLAELGTRRLRELRYECHCTMGNSFDMVTVFLAPWMQSVTALDWVPNLWTSIPEATLQELMKDSKVLSNIETLQYGGPGICEELLTKRMIRRLSSPSMDPSAPINRHPNKKAITHLSISHYHLQTLLTSVGNVNQFCNLQHVGTLHFSHGYNDASDTTRQVINRALELIVDLKKLVSIDGSMRLYKDEGDLWDQPLLSRLETVHPKLCRVFLSGNHSCVWIRGEGLGIWEKRDLAAFTSWDMVTSVYDNL